MSDKCLNSACSVVEQLFFYGSAIHMLTDEYRYKILKKLEAKSDVSQRELARELGISLGKVNFCLNALIEKGLVKANNFRQSENKKGYIYLLTPSGVEEKAKITVRFLKYKLAEYEKIKAEIQQLQHDVASNK